MMVTIELVEKLSQRECLGRVAKRGGGGGWGGVPFTHHAKFLSEILHHGEKF